MSPSRTACDALRPVKGVCVSCGRPTAVYGGVPSHKRGRWREPGAADRIAARLAEIERLDAADICDCGVPLDVHPELSRPKPLGGWESVHDGLYQRASGLTDRQQAYHESRRGQAVHPKVEQSFVIRRRTARTPPRPPQ